MTMERTKQHRRAKQVQEGLVIAIENLRADVQYTIEKSMTLQNVSRTKLAELLNVSLSAVSQMLSPNGNPSVETIAKIFYALSDECKISSEVIDRHDLEELFKAEHRAHFVSLQESSWQSNDNEPVTLAIGNRKLAA